MRKQNGKRGITEWRFKRFDDQVTNLNSLFDFTLEIKSKKGIISDIPVRYKITLVITKFLKKNYFFEINYKLFCFFLFLIKLPENDFYSNEDIE